jgi:hypothetical protein
MELEKTRSKFAAIEEEEEMETCRYKSQIVSRFLCGRCGGGFWECEMLVTFLEREWKRV